MRHRLATMVGRRRPLVTMVLRPPLDTMARLRQHTHPLLDITELLLQVIPLLVRRRHLLGAPRPQLRNLQLTLMLATMAIPRRLLQRPGLHTPLQVGLQVRPQLGTTETPPPTLLHAMSIIARQATHQPIVTVAGIVGMPTTALQFLTLMALHQLVRVVPHRLRVSIPMLLLRAPGACRVPTLTLPHEVILTVAHLVTRMAARRGTTHIE